MGLLSELTKEFNIPKIEENQKVWFFRTKAGRYYHDFRINNYIALGWDLISPELIKDKEKSKESKKEAIEKLYPDEKRPGLIYGQMDTFYNKMKKGDFIIIPSAGGRKISIGKMGDFSEEVHHQYEAEDYPKCEYHHKRLVEWIKTVDSWQDIYLFKAIRAQQTISDITEVSALVFRNLFPIYVSGNTIHLMLQKETNNELNAFSNVEMLMGIFEILEETAELYRRDSFKKDVSLKTAVGSPGFWELILPGTPVAFVAICFFRGIIGKEKAPDGSTATGLMALASKINEFINDYHNRKKVDAETALINAEIEQKKAETVKTLAEAEKIRIDIEVTKRQLLDDGSVGNIKYDQIAFLESGKTTIQEEEEQEKLTIPENEEMIKKIEKIISSGEKVCVAAAGNGIKFDNRKIG